MKGESITGYEYITLNIRMCKVCDNVVVFLAGSIENRFSYYNTFTQYTGSFHIFILETIKMGLLFSSLAKILNVASYMTTRENLKRPYLATFRLDLSIKICMTHHNITGRISSN